MRTIENLDEQGIVTKDSRKLLRKSLRSARRKGHDVQLICKSGSVELYGCLHSRCRDTLDCWDSPSVCNGTLHRRKCKFAPEGPAAGRMLKNIFKFCFTLVRRTWGRFR